MRIIKEYGGIGAILILAMILLFNSRGVPKTLGSAPSGLNASVATSSQAGVSATVTTLVATSTNCAARIITTVAQPIRLSFGSPQQPILEPSGTLGHLQAASTTVTYDGGIWGCGLIRVFGYGNATLTISVTE